MIDTLEDKAKEFVKDLIDSEADYEEIWNKLKRYFENKRYIPDGGYCRTKLRKRQLFYINKFISLDIMYITGRDWFSPNILHSYKIFKLIFLKIFRK